MVSGDLYCLAGTTPSTASHEIELALRARHIDCTRTAFCALTDWLLLQMEVGVAACLLPAFAKSFHCTVTMGKRVQLLVDHIQSYT
eukprot:6462136-Amphidinium_carterae.2